MRFIIHIGPRKTGTTYLQAACFHSQQALAASGIYYHTGIASLGETKIQRSMIGEVLVANRVVDLAEDFLAARARGMHTAIISDETLSHLSAAQVAPLQAMVAELADGDPVQVVSYCRRWSARLPSLWAELVKHGQSRSFAEWLAHLLTMTETSPIIDESINWAIWSDWFGADALRLVSYDVMMDQRADIAVDFLDQFAGWRGEISPRAARAANQRLSAAELEFLRMMNAMAVAQKQTIPERARLRLLREMGLAGDTRFAGLGAPGGAVTPLVDAAPVFDSARGRMAAFAARALVPRGGDTRLMIDGASRQDSPDPVLFGDPVLGAVLREGYARLVEITETNPPPLVMPRPAGGKGGPGKGAALAKG